MGYSRLLQFKRLNLTPLETLEDVVGNLSDDSDFTLQIMERILQGINEGQYVPWKTGALQESALVTPRQISYDTKRTNPDERDYSQRVYTGSWMNFNPVPNINADAYWDKNFMNYEGEYLAKDIDEMLQEKLDGQK